MLFTFERLLAPLSLQEFLDTFYETKPLLLKRVAPSYYDGLITLADVNESLSHAELRAPAVRLVKEGEELPSGRFTYTLRSSTGRVTSGLVDKEALFAKFNEGYTIALNAYERHDSRMFHLRHLAERALKAAIQANIYVTPRESRGFGPHWDSHDVFVLQFAGSKRWLIYDAPIALPSSKHRFNAERWQRGEPLLDTTLEPGDLLYLPRGYVHEARAVAGVSAHVTFGVYTDTYVDLLTRVLSKPGASAWLRRSIPPDFSSSPGRIADFIERATAFLATADVGAVAAEMHDEFAARRLPDATDRLLDYMRLPELTVDTSVARRLSVYFTLSRNDDGVRLNFNNKQLAFPATAADALRFVVETPVFQVSDISPDITDESKVVLCKTLVREGFLMIVESPQRERIGSHSE